MFRTLLFTALLAACSSDDPAHEQVDCATWPQITGATRCEQACAAGPNDPTPGAVCKQPDGKSDCAASNVASFEGERGCCMPDADRVVAFTACEGP